MCHNDDNNLENKCERSLIRAIKNGVRADRNLARAKQCQSRSGERLVERNVSLVAFVLKRRVVFVQRSVRVAARCRVTADKSHYR